VFAYILLIAVTAVCSLQKLGCQENWFLYNSFICILVFPLNFICALHWSCSDQFLITPQPTVILTTQLSQKQAMPSLTLQQFNTLFTTDHHETLHWGNMNSHYSMLKFILILLPCSSDSPKKPLCLFKFPYHNIMLFSFPMPYSMKSFTSLLLSLNTRRIAEPANSHIASSHISCNSSSPTLKAIQHPIQWAPEVPSSVVKWL
jgi:hypothetical protein